MNNSKVAVAVSKTISIIQMLSAIILLFVFGLCTIVTVTDKEAFAENGISFLIICLIFDALGVWLIFLSRKRSKLIKNYKDYVAVVSCNPDGYIPNIAATLGVSEDLVKSNMELMIKKGYFGNAYIDRNSNSIVITNKQNLTNNMVGQLNASASTTKVSFVNQSIERVTVKCKGCGGINTLVKGVVGECDYCGAAIKGE